MAGDITDNIGIYAVPLVIAAITLYGTFRRTDIFSSFCEGAKDGLSALISILPTLVALMLGVEMLSASGFFGLMTELLSPVLGAVGFPAELLPLALIRPVSGSGSAAVLSSILSQNDPDSFIGRCACVMAGSTETTFYAVSVYFGAAGVKNTRYAVIAALIADITGMIMAVVVCRMF